MSEPETNTNEQKPDSNGTQSGRDPKTGQFVAGNKFGEGRQEGSENFATKWRKFIEKVAEKNGMTVDEIDEQLYATAFNQAKKGKYLFFKDIQDRLHGKAVQPLEHKGNIEVGIRSISIIDPTKKDYGNNDTTETVAGHQTDTDTKAV